MQVLFGDCAIIAVAQSIPLEPMEFARLYETTLAQQADNNGDTLSKPSKTLDTRPVCDDLVRDASTDEGFRTRVLDAVVGPEGPLVADSASANETAALVASLRGSGKRRTAISALAGRPVRYAVCSADTWDNSLVLDAEAGHGENAGGRQLTYIAFLNTCPDYDARITLEIVPAGAAAAACSSQPTCASLFNTRQASAPNAACFVGAIQKPLRWRQARVVHPHRGVQARLRIPTARSFALSTAGLFARALPCSCPPHAPLFSSGSSCSFARAAARAGAAAPKRAALPALAPEGRARAGTARAPGSDSAGAAREPSMQLAHCMRLPAAHCSRHSTKEMQERLERVQGAARRAGAHQCRRRVALAAPERAVHPRLPHVPAAPRSVVRAR